jgi:hypothetical protein
VRLEASTKPHVHQKFEIFWTNIASTMASPNLKNGPKNGLCPLGVKGMEEQKGSMGNTCELCGNFGRSGKTFFLLWV